MQDFNSINIGKSNKIRYIIFIVTVIITIIANELIVQHQINLQLADAKIINMAGKQRMLSQQISKAVLFLESENHLSGKNKLAALVKEWSKAHKLLSKEKVGIENTPEIKRLYIKLQPYYANLLEGTRSFISSESKSAQKEGLNKVLASEGHFLDIMDQIVSAYQQNAENKLKRTKNTVLLLSCLSVLILIGEFIFIIVPFYSRLKQQNQELNQTNRRLSDFAHITSHNLRAPVSNLNSLLHIYEISEDPEEKEDIVSKFNTVLSHLNETMNTLVDALQTQHASTKEKELVALDESLSKNLEILGAQIDESKIKITSDFSKINTVLYNKIYMDSIFLNLVSNAIKYRSKKNPAELSITSTIEKGRTVIRFRDNGLGIDLKKHGDKLFGLSKTFHRHPEARGIGLFMTRTQIESLGGTITATSEVNKGTTFQIIL
jgi:nitrate/nitrite-specific signal transduction histidine kinase